MDNNQPIEERHITVKRKYTENHPAVKVGKAARIRNKVLEAIKDGKLTKEEFDTILKEMTVDSTRWIKRNATYFNVSEDGITLSKTGKKILNELTTTKDINEKATPFKIANARAEEIFGEFGVATLDYSQVARVIDIKLADKLAKKYGEDSFMALSELDMEELLNKNPKLVKENKTNNNMKTNFVFESFGDFVNSLNTTDKSKELVNEAKSFSESELKSTAQSVADALAKVDNTKVNVIEFEMNPAKGRVAGFYVHKATNKKGAPSRYWITDSGEVVSAFRNDTFGDGVVGKVGSSVADFIKTFKANESLVTEAFKSSLLASLFNDKYGKFDKNLAKAFYGTAKVKMDLIEDEDLLTVDPQTAYKNKQADTIIFYLSDTPKENPHAPSDAWMDHKQIPGEGYLLAVTSGDNAFYTRTWGSRYSSNREQTLKKVENGSTDSIGISKKYKGWDGTGLYNVKRIAEVADRAIILNMALLKQKYSSDGQRDARAAAKKGAIAFKSHKDFKKENMDRYHQILANKAASLPLDKMVAGAIEALTTQIKDGLAKGEKGRYEDIIIGRKANGAEARLRDASNHMSHILDDYNRYVSYIGQAEESEKQYGDKESYYEREAKNYAKSIKDRINQIESFDYVW